MASDDYLVYLQDRREGLWGGVAQIYGHWTGRFVATFILFFFVDNDIPARYYFIHTLLLLAGMGCAYYFLLTSLNKKLLGDIFSRVRLLQTSIVLLLLTLYVQAEVSTGFYWFSSSLTYQPPYIFSLLIAGLLIRGSATQTQSIKMVYVIPALLLAVLVCGTTEIGPLYLMLSLLATSIFIYRVTGKIPAAVVACLVVTLVAGVVVMLTCGLFSGRARLMNGHTGMVSILPMVLFRGSSVFYYILRVPAFWVISFLLYGLGLKLSLMEGNRLSTAPWGGRRILVPGLVAIAVAVILSLGPILAITKGSFPTRSLDTLVDMAAGSLLILVFLSGNMDTKTAALVKEIKVPATVPMGLLIVTLMATDPLIEAWESVFSGYFYHGMVQERKKQIQEALSSGKRTVVIKPVAIGVEDKIKERFPNGIFETVHSMLL